MTALSSKCYWQEKPVPGDEAVQRLVHTLKIPQAGAHFLASRGMDTPEAAARYLSLDGVGFHDPFLD